MSKKPKQKCKHGNSPIYVQGCPTCVMAAMVGAGICNDNGWTPEELWQLLHHAFPTAEALDAAIKFVRAKIAERDAATKGKP